MHRLLHSKLASLTLVLAVVLGVAIHDTKIDAVAALAAVPIALIAVEPGKTLLGASMAHTHHERVSFSKTVSKHTSWMPRVKSGKDSDASYRLSKKVPKGHHPFDGYTVPAF